MVYECGNSTERDTINNQTETIFWNFFEGDSSINISSLREINFFSQNNLLDSTYFLIGDSITRSRIYAYNTEEQLIQKTFFLSHSSNSLVPSTQIRFEYNNDGRLIFEDYFNWTEENGWQQQLSGDKEWFYSENGILQQEINYGGLVIETPPNVINQRQIFHYARPLITSNNTTIPEAYTFKVFPNPARQFLHIEAKGVTTFPIQLTMLNLQGQILNQQTLYTNLETIDLSALPKGSYFVRMEDSGGNVGVRKVIKQ